jgi:hypothetical protein
MSARNGKFKNRGFKSKKVARQARANARAVDWNNLSDAEKIHAEGRNKADYNIIRAAR